MKRTLSVHDSIVVAADPAAVYDLVSDPTRMSRWSPENTGAVISQARPGGAYEGMEFDGRNTRGGATWTTRCVVTAADRGERFAFRVVAIGVKSPTLKGRNASWEYRFAAVPGGTEVTETWTDDRRWPDLVATVFDKIVTRGHHFADFQRRNIARTLAALQKDLGAPS